MHVYMHIFNYRMTSFFLVSYSIHKYDMNMNVAFKANEPLSAAVTDRVSENVKLAKADDGGA